VHGKEQELSALSSLFPPQLALKFALYPSSILAIVASNQEIFTKFTIFQLCMIDVKKSM
jgi:hypothetical protein